MPRDATDAPTRLPPYRLLPIDDLIEYENNARTHSDDQIALLARMIEEYGWTNPVLIDRDKGIIAGHGRVLAARQLGMTSVPTIKLAHLTDAQKRAYVIADNKSAELAGWDRDLLRLELGELRTDGFDLPLTGFGEGELKRLFGEESAAEGEAAEYPAGIPEVPAEPVTRPGDVWRMGRHRLICGDVRTALAALPDDSVQCVVTSPPYFGLRDYKVAGQIGLEPTPDAFLAELVAVFREVRRVLRPDGVAFVNMGDSYASAGGATQPQRDTSGGFGGEDFGTRGRQGYAAASGGHDRPATIGGSIKPKDLMMMPARLALALQADGWGLRSDIIWHKPNPMPESVTDRPTSAHEHVFLLTKSESYFWDAEAVKEPVTGNAHPRGDGITPKSQPAGQGIKSNVSFHAAVNELVDTRNCRNVWTIQTAPYSEAHFATFPPALAERCIRAGTSERGACRCGAPWGREVERPVAPADVMTRRSAPTDGKIHSGSTVDGEMVGHGQKLQNWRNANPSVTVGWQPTCDCGTLDANPCTVLDPFGGAFTTGIVAERLDRACTAVELSPAYCDVAVKRWQEFAGQAATREADGAPFPGAD